MRAESDWVVVAVPPAQGTYAHMGPRCQMQGGKVAFFTEKEAKEQARACNADRNGWKYEARPWKEEITQEFWLPAEQTQVFVDKWSQSKTPGIKVHEN